MTGILRLEAGLAGPGTEARVGPGLKVAAAVVAVTAGAVAAVEVLATGAATAAVAVVVGAAVGISAAATCVWCCSR